MGSTAQLVAAEAVNYTPGLALLDVVPVVAAGVAFVGVAGIVRDRAAHWYRLALIGAILATVGGSAKAGWKLVRAIGDTDISGLDDLLFPGLAPGFTLMAISYQAARTGRIPRWLIGIAGVAIVGSAALGVSVSSRAWVIPLISLATVSSTWLVIQLIIDARRHQLAGVTVLFVANLVITFVLSGLARIPQTDALQWFEESVNSASQIGLAFGVWRLRRALSERPEASSADTRHATI